MFTLRGVTKRFPGRAAAALDGIDLEARNGEVLGLVGLNGAGKTTAIRVCVGLAKPSKGTVTIDGHDLAHEKAIASRGVGWVPELFPYDPGARALPLLMYYAGFNGLSRREARPRARELLDEVGLGAVHDLRIRTFSQGMKRRFGLAAVMLSDPPNLLLDEVLNGLDPEGIAFVRRWTLQQRREKKSVLLSSHLLSELQAIADRVAFIHQGRLLRTIDRQELERAAGSEVRIAIENLDDAGRDLLRGFGAFREEGRTVVLDRPDRSVAEINAELVRHGYRVSELRSGGSSLESYFFELLGTAR